jgi:hypothetical protein
MGLESASRTLMLDKDASVVITLPAREIVAICDWGEVYGTGARVSVIREPAERSKRGLHLWKTLQPQSNRLLKPLA